MTNLMQVTENAVVSMTSLEIAELTGKEHKNVLRDIRSMLEELYGEDRLLSFEQTVLRPNPSGGAAIPSNIFNLPKRETLILVSGYSTLVRAKIIDRITELETQVQQLLAERVEAQTLKIEELNQRRNKVMENFSNFAAENIQTWTRITAVKKQLKGMEKELKLFVDDQVSRLREISIALRIAGDAETADDLIALIKEMQRDAAKLKPQPNLELDLWMSNSEVLLNNYLSEKLRAN